MANYTQARDANMNTGYTGGWCLSFVQDAFRTDHPYPTAMAAWNAEPVATSHGERPPLGITVPVYFSLGSEPAGHIAIRLDDGMVASSTLAGKHSQPYFHKSIDDLIATYAPYNGGCKYLGWGETVGSVKVVVPATPNATDSQILAAYLDILERPADAAGLANYRNFTNDQVRSSLLNSPEYQTVQANKKAQADAAVIAQAQAEAKAKADADAKAQADADQKAREDAIKNQPPVIALPPQIDYAKENNGLLKQIIDLIKRIFNVA